MTSLSTEFTDSLCEKFAADRSARTAQNAVTATSIVNVSLNREAIVRGKDFSCSVKLDDWSATNQKSSGRCWIFAALNLMRPGTMSKMKLKKFEFSQNYVFFYEKLERANHFLSAVIDLADRDIDDRTLAYLLDKPLDDGGQWDMFVAVVKKYGVVPQWIMPESESSSSTLWMNRSVCALLRQGAAQMRAEFASGSVMRDQLHATTKAKILASVHRILSIHLGTPPRAFELQWTDKDKAFHRVADMTPLRFLADYTSIELDDYVCLVNDPRASSPYNALYTVQYLGNVVGSAPVRYLNVPMETMRALTVATLTKEREPVWFGCDCGKSLHRIDGVWDTQLYDLEGLYGVDLTMDKAARLNHHQTLMTHAMLFTGVDLDDDAITPRRFRVENSWGSDKSGKDGFYMMTADWFNEHLFEVAIKKSLLSADLLAVIDEGTVTTLPAWDPMGALARSHDCSLTH